MISALSVYETFAFKQEVQKNISQKSVYRKLKGPTMNNANSVLIR